MDNATSVLSTEMGFELMEKLLPHVAAILSDEELTDAKTAIRAEETFHVGRAFDNLMPLFLGKHREHVLAMAAVISGKTLEEVKAQPLHDTVTALRQNITGDMMIFFGSCLRVAMSA